MEIGLQHYNLIDRSGSASPLVSHIRGRNPAGALIHSTAGTDSTTWLSGGSAASGTPASCNELVQRDGTVIIICADNRYPYHAGQSSANIGGATLTGDALSERLFGWEQEYLNTQAPTYQQYDSLAQRITRRAIQYGWRWPYVMFGHYGVALPVGRRSDPYAYDWGSLMGRLYVYARAWDVPGL